MEYIDLRRYDSSTSKLAHNYHIYFFDLNFIHALMKKIFTHLFTASALLTASVPAATAETAYGYSWGESTGLTFGFVSFDSNAPQTLNYQKRFYGYQHVSAGEYVDGKLYTYLIEYDDWNNIAPSAWTVYDAETFATISSKSMTDARVVDMTFDYTTNTLYALVEDGYRTGTVGPTSLCAVDMATGEYTVIGSPGELTAIDGNNHLDIDGLVTLAADADGQLWAMSYYRYFYKVDKFTAKLTQVGERHNLGTRSDFQSMAFDNEGHLWWAQNHPSYGHFCEIDLQTAIPGGFVDFRTDYDKLNKLGKDAQVTSLYFKGKEINRSAIKAVTGLSAAIAAGDVHTVNLTWTLPVEDISGQAASATGIRVYRLGTSEPIATLPADATTYADTEAPDGTVTYQVVPFNDAGTGYPAFTEVFAGYDRLTEPTDINLALDGRDVTLTWRAPQSTVNGGYADYDAITYNIYRVKGSEVESVAEDVAELEFAETVTIDGGFYYLVEPVCGGVKGVQGKSETFVLSSSSKIPYFTGFEDEHDGLQWTFINNPNAGTNYGWSIGKKSYVYEGNKTAVASNGGAATQGDNWLMSPPIEIEAGNYVIDYWVLGASYDKDSYDVALGTDPKDPATFTQNIFTHENEYAYDEANKANRGWAHVEQEFSVPVSGTYHLGVLHRSPSTYSNLRIDNLSINAKPAAIDGVGADKAAVTVSVFAGTVTVTSSVEVARVEVIDMQGRTLKAAAASTLNASGISGINIVAVTLADGSRVYSKIKF